MKLFAREENEASYIPIIPTIPLISKNKSRKCSKTEEEKSGLRYHPP